MTMKSTASLTSNKETLTFIHSHTHLVSFSSPLETKINTNSLSLNLLMSFFLYSTTLVILCVGISALPLGFPTKQSQLCNTFAEGIIPCAYQCIVLLSPKSICQKMNKSTSSVTTRAIHSPRNSTVSEEHLRCLSKQISFPFSCYVHCPFWYPQEDHTRQIGILLIRDLFLDGLTALK